MIQTALGCSPFEDYQSMKRLTDTLGLLGYFCAEAHRNGIDLTFSLGQKVERMLTELSYRINEWTLIREYSAEQNA
jgi:hypothetical protein